MDALNINTAVYFLGPKDPTECHKRIETILGCSLTLLEGEKYEEDPPRFEGEALGLRIILSAKDRIWTEGRVYLLTLICDGRLIVLPAPTVDLASHFAGLLKLNGITVAYNAEDYAEEFRHRKTLASSQNS